MESDTAVRSIQRSMSVLREVNRAGSLSLMEIAHACEIPYPTARRITRTLVGEGMLEREPTRKNYRPTVLVKSLSHGYQDHSMLTDICRPHLLELTKKYLWPVSLVTRVGQMMIVRDCTHSVSPMAMHNYSAGATFPLLESASGHIYLAYADVEERLRLLQAGEELGQLADPLSLRQFRSGELATAIQHDGYVARARNRFTNTPGRTSSISTPVFKDGELCAALTMTVFSSSMTVQIAAERYVPALKRAATRIAKEMSLSDHEPAPMNKSVRMSLNDDDQDKRSPVAAWA